MIVQLNRPAGMILAATVSAALVACEAPPRPRDCAEQGPDPRAVLLADARGPSEIVLDETYVYWVGRGFHKVPKDGGQAVSLSGVAGPGLAFDGTHLYSVLDRNGIFKQPVDGGDAVLLPTDSSLPKIYGSVAVDDTHVYFNGIEPLGSTAIFKIPKQGGEPILLQGDIIEPVGITLDETHVFWASHPDLALDDRSIMKVPKQGGSATTLARAVPRAKAIAVDDTDVYFTNFKVIVGDIRKVSKAGGEVTILAECLDEPVSIAVDDTHVYWANLGRYTGGSVMKTPKNP